MCENPNCEHCDGVERHTCPGCGAHQQVTPTPGHSTVVVCPACNVPMQPPLFPTNRTHDRPNF